MYCLMKSLRDVGEGPFYLLLHSEFTRLNESRMGILILYDTSCGGAALRSTLQVVL